MLHNFEHVLLVIHRVADGESRELCGEHASVLEPDTFSWMGCPELLKLRVKLTGEANLYFVTRAWLRKAVT
jgi:hypothetical protein